MTGKEWLYALADEAAALVGQALEGIGIPAHRQIAGPVSWADIVTLLCLVLFVSIINLVTAAALRRRTQRTLEERPTAWQAQLWQAAGRPFGLLIWVYGGYFAAAPILRKLPDTKGAAVGQAFDKIFEAGVFLAVLWLLIRSTHAMEARLQAWASTTRSRLDDLFVPLLCRTLRVVAPMVGLILALPLLTLPAAYAGVISRLGSVLLIGAVAWILFQAVQLGEKAVLARFDIKAADNLEARKVYTQVHVLSKTLHVLIAIFAAASILMLFDEVRRFGASILASAGVIGIIVGVAAQRTIANLFAGFQLAITQPIRLDDVVIVENEWGRIEEITLTYVVVKIWDERRLIVPLSYFIEKPFQNWTRASAELLGSVFLWTDFSVSLPELRLAVHKIVANAPDWDKRFWNLQVTDTTDRAMQIRVLATAADASKAWDLRCHIREQLLTYLGATHPSTLPRVRLSFESAPGMSHSPSTEHGRLAGHSG